MICRCWTGNTPTFRQHDHGALPAGDAHPLLVKVPHVKVACSRTANMSAAATALTGRRQCMLKIATFVNSCKADCRTTAV